MKNILFWIFAATVWGILASITLYSIISGNIPFWYDPARDMLSAWDNLSNITFVGPTAGIPGIFYGPYWIWFLSVPMIFSKDPRFVSFAASFIPYFIVFPIVLFKYKNFDKKSAYILWLFLVLGFQQYAVHIWNPYNSPLLLLLSIYLILYSQGQKNKNNILMMLLSGFSLGLAVNINLSFGAVAVIGLVVYLLLDALYSLRKYLLKKLFRIPVFIAGIMLTFVPFIFFELKHGFTQTKIAFSALLSGGAGIVGIHGLAKMQIIEALFSRWQQIIQAPFGLSFIILLLLTVTFCMLWFKNKISFSDTDKKLLLMIACVFSACLGLYLLVSNPVWDYHFTGIEAVWLLLLGIFLVKIPIFKYIAYIWVLFLVTIKLFGFASGIGSPVLDANSLKVKETITRAIIVDIQDKQYSVFAYSPSIYTYEYSYLFRWLAKKEIPYDPGQIKKIGDIYLILPPYEESVSMDFINYRTPAKLYKTIKIWSLPDGTSILKRSLK